MGYLKDTNERSVASISGKKIKELREQQKMSQEELAEILECSEETIGKVERGIQTMKYWRLIRLCEVFHVSLDFVLRDFDPSSLTSVPSYVIKLFHDADVMELEILSDHLQSARRAIERKHILENRVKPSSQNEVDSMNQPDSQNKSGSQNKSDSQNDET